MRRPPVAAALTESVTLSCHTDVVLTRRSFLSLIPALFVRPRPLEEGKGPMLLTTTIAGYRFHDGPRIEHHLHEGDPLILRREANNPHDRRAVAVDHPGGLCIGYLPRRGNEIPSRLLDQGVAICAEIVRIAPPPAEPRKRVEVAIRLLSWDKRARGDASESSGCLGQSCNIAVMKTTPIFTMMC